MKTYRETSDEVFEKIGEDERAKKRRRRAALRVARPQLLPLADDRLLLRPQRLQQRQRLGVLLNDLRPPGLFLARFVHAF